MGAISYFQAFRKPLISQSVSTCLCLLLVLLPLPYTFAIAPPPTRFEFSQAHMGTQFRLILYAPDATLASRAAQAAFTEVARLDLVMSDYNQASELNHLCHQGVNRKTKISPDLFRILSLSQQLAAETDGAFDVTVGAVVRLWRRTRRTGSLPAEESIAQALVRTGYRNLHLDARTQTAWLERDGVLLDLGGIAKGYAADAAMHIIKRFGIRSALVAAGGDIVVSDAPPASSGWTIAIATANATEPSAPPIVITNAAVSTSGDAEQFVEIEGVRYSHIVDPRTGIGLIGRRSVTVVARRGVDADSLATALSVMGERGLAGMDNWLTRKKGVAALLVVETRQGFVTFASKRWKALRQRQPASEQ